MFGHGEPWSAMVATITFGEFCGEGLAEVAEEGGDSEQNEAGQRGGEAARCRGMGGLRWPRGRG